jgi:two-component system chemotaxis response regulator CheY
MARPTEKRRPLLVDDDDDVREAVRDTLIAEGYEIDEARNGVEGLEYLRSHSPPPLVLLDWNMAPMNGGQFMTELAKDERLSATPIVLLTADVRASAKADAHPFAGYLKKPVNLEALFEVMARYCG